MIHKAGAGPEPIPHKQLNVTKLTDAIKFAISPSAKVAAKAMADEIKSEVRSIVLFSPQSLTAMPCIGRSEARSGQFLPTLASFKYEMRFGPLKSRSVVVFRTCMEELPIFDVL
jgi:hypothetical protein